MVRQSYFKQEVKGWRLYQAIIFLKKNCKKCPKWDLNH